MHDRLVLDNLISSMYLLFWVHGASKNDCASDIGDATQWLRVRRRPRHEEAEAEAAINNESVTGAEEER